MDLFAENINLNFKHAKEDRESIETDLKEFIGTTFKDFMEKKYEPLEKRVIKVERVAWVLGGFWVIFVAMLIWGMQHLLSGL